MQLDNKPPQRPKRKRRILLPLSAEELALLHQKRFIDEFELLRLLQVSSSTMYKLIKQKQLTPARIGCKKMFDIEDLYNHLEASKKKHRR